MKIIIIEKERKSDKLTHDVYQSMQEALNIILWAQLAIASIVIVLSILCTAYFCSKKTFEKSTLCLILPVVYANAYLVFYSTGCLDLSDLERVYWCMCTLILNNWNNFGFAALYFRSSRTLNLFFIRREKIDSNRNDDVPKLNRTICRLAWVFWAI